MESFELLLEESTRVHGHVCPGQVLGVRMCMLGLKLIDIRDPKGKDRKKIYVLVEIDRCATDAIQSVTGCSLGKRTLRWLDYGIMAATFVNLETTHAVRITAREESRDLARDYCRHIVEPHGQQLEAYKVMPDEELFAVEYVSVDIPAENLPGRPKRKVQCDNCHEWVQDNRDVGDDGRILCRSCAGERYYTIVDNVLNY